MNDVTQFSELYVRFFQPNDGKLHMPFYIQWMQTQSGSPSVVHFQNHILNCREYHDYLRTDFIHLWDVWIDRSSYTEELFNQFIQLTIQKMRNTDKEPICKKHMLHYIKEHHLFNAKYTDMISRLYQIVNQEVIPDSILESYLEKLKIEDSYSLEQLNEDILANRLPNARGNNILQLIQEKWRVLHGVRPTSKEVEKILDIMMSSEETVEVIVRNQNVFRNQANFEFIKNFNNVFERDISVYEYLKYMPLSDTIKNKLEDTTWIQKLKSAHTVNYTTVKNLYKQYLDAELSESVYFQKYIYLVDTDGYQTDIITELVKTPLYKTEMCKRIQEIYLELYRCKLETQDLEYVFNCIQQARIDIKSGSITEKVTALYKETESYMASMKKVYTKILSREPDSLEVVEHLKKYRDMADSSKTDSLLQEDLYTGFEYHDILKARIRDMYKSLSKKDILPSQQFAVLKEVLNQNDIIRHMDSLKEFVRNYFGLPVSVPELGKAGKSSDASTNMTSLRPDKSTREDKK